jgi:hypothetical protein
VDASDDSSNRSAPGRALDLPLNAIADDSVHFRTNGKQIRTNRF